MGFGGFFVLKIVVLFLMRGWGYITTKALAPNLNTTNQFNTQAKAIDIQKIVVLFLMRGWGHVFTIKG
jgi:hypothetical protein